MGKHALTADELDERVDQPGLCRRSRLRRRTHDLRDQPGRLQGQAAGCLPARVAHRRRRHGRGLARQPSHAGAARRDQADRVPPPGRRCPRGADSVRAGSTGDGPASLSAYGGGLRFRAIRRRFLLLRHGIARRRGSAGTRPRTRTIARSREWCTSCARLVTPWARPTTPDSFTATSNRRTSSSADTAATSTSSKCSTSDWSNSGISPRIRH